MKKRYWLRAGMVGIIIGVVITFVQVILLLNCSTDWFCGLVFLFPIGFIVDPILQRLFSYEFGHQFGIPILIFLQLLIPGIIFSVCSWLYGKIVKNPSK